MKGLRVFIVEDESLVAMQLEDMLMDLGCDFVGSAMRVGRAIEATTPELALDVAVLDVNLGGETVYPVARHLAGMGVRLVFATGYGRGGLEAEWRDHPVLQKPYTEAQVANALEEAMKVSAAA